jgi:hypothetical protein
LRRVGDPAVVDRQERLHHAPLDQLQLSHRQVALVELAVEQPLHRQLVHQGLDAAAGRLAH